MPKCDGSELRWGYRHTGIPTAAGKGLAPPRRDGYRVRIGRDVRQATVGDLALLAAGENLIELEPQLPQDAQSHCKARRPATEEPGNRAPADPRLLRDV